MEGRVDGDGNPAFGAFAGLLLLIGELRGVPEVKGCPGEPQAVAHTGSGVVPEEDQGAPFLVRAGLQDALHFLVRERELGLALAVGDLDRGGWVDGAHALVERPLEHHPQHDDTLPDRRRRGALGHARLDEGLHVRRLHADDGLIGLRSHVLQEQVNGLAVGGDGGRLLVDRLRRQEVGEESAQGGEAQAAAGRALMHVHRVIDHLLDDQPAVVLRRARVVLELLQDLLGKFPVGRACGALQPFSVRCAEARQPVFRTLDLSEE